MFCFRRAGALVQLQFAVVDARWRPVTASRRTNRRCSIQVSGVLKTKNPLILIMYYDVERILFRRFYYTILHLNIAQEFQAYYMSLLHIWLASGSSTMFDTPVCEGNKPPRPL